MSGPDLTRRCPYLSVMGVTMQGMSGRRELLLCMRILGRMLVLRSLTMRISAVDNYRYNSARDQKIFRCKTYQNFIRRARKDRCLMPSIMSYAR